MQDSGGVVQASRACCSCDVGHKGEVGEENTSVRGGEGGGEGRGGGRGGGGGGLDLGVPDVPDVNATCEGEEGEGEGRGVATWEGSRVRGGDVIVKGGYG